MCEIDHSHHAEHNRQPRADEREEGDHVENLQQNNGYVVHAFTNIRESDSFNIGKAWPKPPDASDVRSSPQTACSRSDSWKDRSTARYRTAAAAWRCR